MLGLVILAVILGNAAADPPKRVVCYYTNWAQYRPNGQKFFPENVNAKDCTHINYAFARLNGNQLAPYEWNDDSTDWSKGMYERLHDFAKAENPDVKILLSIGGWNMASAPFTALVATPANRKEFATTSVKFLRDRNFDGLDLDWEYPARRGSPPEDRENYLQLLKILRDTYDKESSDKPTLLLTAAVPAGKSNIDPGYDIPQVAKNLDFINIMTYDLHGAWETETGHNSPLYSRDGESGEQRELNVDWAARYWAQQGAPKDKLVIGLPTYGRSFTLKTTSNTGVGAEAKGAGTAGQYTREAGMLAYYEICKMIDEGAEVHQIEEQKVPYLVQGDQWVGYDDANSLKLKVQYMKDNGYGGVMIWAYDLDDFTGSCGQGNYPLLTAIKDAMDNTGTPTTNPLSTPKPSTAPPTSASTSTSATTSTTPGTTTPAPTTSSPTTTVASTTEKVTQPPTATANTPTETGEDLTNFCENRSDGFYAFPGDCRQYIQCSHGNTYVQKCAPGTAYNPVTGYFDHDYNVPGCVDK